MTSLTYDVAYSLSRSSRASFTRTYALSLVGFGVALFVAAMIGG